MFGAVAEFSTRRSIDRFWFEQATESSAGFYDRSAFLSRAISTPYRACFLSSHGCRMGFRRVGALAKYITSDVAPHQVRLIIIAHAQISNN
mmetsp:Transcript_33262/g.69667  ORF Transcript_33262/g.69667 Transcript_33262/m.69667 type:complete len:91 (-) Transcript_33262:1087-1359(-)